ncbi:hypothetical protein GCM10017562_02260 [Streptomyces roseofulvus]|uniref:DUF732 domain-containing protein n=2 Tax=Streptomyces TaxID=1883 RepID=A0ABU4JZP9_9ACTN|nr:hypothetical protein [Streptomyces roseolus]MDX2290969.1 hypothetical protein [Streptomyces roseolus]
MRIKTISLIATTALALALTACSAADNPPATSTSKDGAQASTAAAPPAADDAPKSGLPPKPTGKKRTELLEALAVVAPDVVRFEEKAIDASRNQCSGLTSDRAAWLASQRFTYKDVTTDEAIGAAINQVLKDLKFCDV